MQKIQTVKLYYRSDSIISKKWELELRKWIKLNYPKIKVVDKNPQAVIVLGGDGTILESAKKYLLSKSFIIGLNLGQAGFLASVRKTENFFSSLEKVFKGNYFISERMLLEINVERKGKIIFKTTALNEAIIINPLGMVEIDIYVSDYHLQKIHGTGALVSTPTGSTAFNLSAHGPIMMSDTKGIILTELFDHNIPTPSMILNGNKKVKLKISNFRKKNLLSITKSKKSLDVLLSADGESIFPLEIGDIVKIKQSPYTSKFCELEKDHFLKSFKEKFDFK
ncbi:hypothetical protein COV23_01475 [Candidatus Wolfebacteria bacterium CG10_big_fil_rev_8_21_14_0_10_31_9]|uniref:NAD kinase n=1 Tax=Candidatus Wolfebacteria bacterium CG10_big_fil_rev_8_21_14_0_10_31_9 TaxID=1975070 RepID=A0A2H0RCN3_9BACT|nr:MAG: hypothetical protein COV23_01475 [Candidatus Wolfebacteria bacterium CG10_big_fil_rev_8_21_14_0_10_31_9]